MPPTVSVVIPTFNRADMIGDAIRSVIDQTYSDWELIVVDDGSEDHTGEVVRSYRDSRISYLYQSNAGTSAARNAGILASSGRYVALLDSDDLFLPNKLRLQVAAMERDTELGLVASGWTEINAHKRPLRSYRPWLLHPGLTLADWLYGRVMIPPAFLVQRRWLLEIGMFDIDLRYAEDGDLWLRLAYSGCKMAWEAGLVCLRTVHGESKIRDVAAMHAGTLAMYDKFFDQTDLPEALSRERNHYYAFVHLAHAVRSLGAGDASGGEAGLASAIRLEPTLLQGFPPRILQSWASAAHTSQVPDTKLYINVTCTVLPQVSSTLIRSYHQLAAMIYATAAFRDAANGRRLQARFQAAKALLRDPSWMNNHGLLKILLAPH